MNKFFSLIALIAALVPVILSCGQSQEMRPAVNPIIWADIPDLSILRHENTYYMSSTTMHMNPGVPVMKSTDLVNWEMVSYAYSSLADTRDMSLENGESAYGRGSWASSLRYHNGRFHLATFSNNTNQTHIFSTANIESGKWERIDFSPKFHDCSLFFDDDGKVYLVHGAGDIRITELRKDLSGVKENGIDQVMVKDASLVAGANVGLAAEGSHVYKINGYYYLFLITWPKNGIRTQLVFRSRSLTGEWTGRVALSDRGIAQGGIIDTPDGDWFGLLFRDAGAVGRIPYLVPVHWKNDWPVFGMNGEVPDTLDIMVNKQGIGGIISSDEFDYADNELALTWQWNHNPDSANWSLTERPGYLRVRNGRIDSSLTRTLNTLTQRSFGPQCEGAIRLETDSLKDGDIAGIAALQKEYGLIGIMNEGGNRYFVQLFQEGDELRAVKLSPLTGNNAYLKITMDFTGQSDTARFFYSDNGVNWSDTGHPLHMRYTLPHFMGYRYALFNFAQKNTGGYADFDWFRISNP